MGGAQAQRGGEFPVVHVDGDDPGRAREPGAHDGGAADAAAADHGHGVAPADVAGVDGCAEAGHHPAAEQAGGGRGGGGVDLGALSGGDQGLVGEGADAEGGRQFGAVLQGHPLLGIVGVEAVLRPSAPTGPALAADGTPVEDHEVAGGDLGDALAHRLDDPGGLVAEQERELVVDAALAVVQVGVADAAGLDLCHGFAGSGVGHQDRLDPDRLALAGRDHTAYSLGHGCCSPSTCPARRVAPMCVVGATPRGAPTGVRRGCPDGGAGARTVGPPGWPGRPLPPLCLIRQWITTCRAHPPGRAVPGGLPPGSRGASAPRAIVVPLTGYDDPSVMEVYTP